MKKLQILLTSGLLGLTSTTFAVNGPYIQLEAGASQIKVEDSTTSDNTTHFSPKLSLGYKENDLRFALDYQYFSAKEDTETSVLNGVVDSQHKTTSKIQSLGATIFYDFENETDFTPYVGARISYNKASIKSESNYGDGTAYSAKVSDKKVGYGALAGIDYKITENLTMGAQIEYNHLGKFQFVEGEEKVKANQFGVSTSIRYTF